MRAHPANGLGKRGTTMRLPEEMALLSQILCFVSFQPSVDSGREPEKDSGRPGKMFVPRWEDSAAAGTKRALAGLWPEWMVLRNDA